MNAYCSLITVLMFLYPILAHAAPCPPRPLADPSQCGGGPCVVDFKRSASAEVNPDDLQRFIDSARRENTTVRLGPNVELDFSKVAADHFPIEFGRCVTLMSVTAFETEPVVG